MYDVRARHRKTFEEINSVYLYISLLEHQQIAKTIIFSIDIIFSPFMTQRGWKEEERTRYSIAAKVQIPYFLFI